MSELEALRKKIVEFRDAREWKQFHNPKDLALSLVLEAAEVMEHFQWKSADEVERHIRDKQADIGDELADVLYYLLLIANDTGIDIVEAFERKMKQNAQKYPVNKAKGRHTKYTDL